VTPTAFAPHLRPPPPPSPTRSTGPCVATPLHRLFAYPPWSLFFFFLFFFFPIRGPKSTHFPLPPLRDNDLCNSRFCTLSHSHSSPKPIQPGGFLGARVELFFLNLKVSPCRTLACSRRPFGANRALWHLFPPLKLKNLSSFFWVQPNVRFPRLYDTHLASPLRLFLRKVQRQVVVANLPNIRNTFSLLQTRGWTNNSKLSPGLTPLTSSHSGFHLPFSRRASFVNLQQALFGSNSPPPCET